jgi:hypothetical protein
MSLSYLPLVTAILSALLGYFFGQRTKKTERVIQYSQDNIKEIYSPMYHQLLEIFNEYLTSIERENLLDIFFKKHLAPDTTIFKLGNVELLDVFYELSQKYSKFKSIRDNSIWKDFWLALENDLYLKVKEEYRSLNSLVYHEFKWQQHILNKPYWLKSYFELMKFLFETSKGTVVALTLMVYISGFLKLFGNDLLPADFFKLSFMFLGMSLTIMISLVVPNIPYISLSTGSKKNSFGRLILKKMVPKLLDWWDKLFLLKHTNDYRKVPKMYDKNNIEGKM